MCNKPQGVNGMNSATPFRGSALVSLTKGNLPRRGPLGHPVVTKMSGIVKKRVFQIGSEVISSKSSNSIIAPLNLRCASTKANDETNPKVTVRFTGYRTPFQIPYSIL